VEITNNMKQDNILDDFLISNQMGDATGLIAYEEVYHEEELIELLSLLRENNIYYEAKRPTKAVGDKVILGEAPNLPIGIVSLLQGDFDEVEALREKELMAQFNQEVPKDHYLQSFSTDELIRVIKESSKWHFNDHVFAKHLLDARGIKYDNLSQEENVAIATKSHQQKSLSYLWLIVLAIFCVPISFTGSYLALAFALPYPFFLWYGKNKDWANNSYPTYDERTRQIGLAIFIVSLLAFVAGISYWGMDFSGNFDSL
jgi:hypothetical protein